MSGRSWAGAAIVALGSIGCVGAGADPCGEAALLAESCRGTEVAPPASCDGEMREAAEQVLAGGCEALPEDGKADSSSFLCSRALRWMGFCTMSRGEANAAYIERLMPVSPAADAYEGLAFLDTTECTFIVEHEISEVARETFFSATLSTEERTEVFTIGTHDAERVTDFNASSNALSQQVYMEADVPTFGKTHIVMERIPDRYEGPTTFRVWMGSGPARDDISCELYLCPDGSRWSSSAACPR